MYSTQLCHSNCPVLLYKKIISGTLEGFVFGGGYFALGTVLEYGGWVGRNHWIRIVVYCTVLYG